MFPVEGMHRRGQMWQGQAEKLRSCYTSKYENLVNGGKDCVENDSEVGVEDGSHWSKDELDSSHLSLK